MPETQASPYLGGTAFETLKTHYAISVIKHWKELSAKIVGCSQGLTVSEVSYFDDRRGTVNVREEDVVRVNV